MRGKKNQNFFRHYQWFLAALRLHDGFRKDTDAAFASFWAREHKTIEEIEFIHLNEDGQEIYRERLGRLEKPEENSIVLMHYLNSPEAKYVMQKYGLFCPYHYKEDGLPLRIFSTIHADVLSTDKNNIIFNYFPIKGSYNIKTDTMKAVINLECPKKLIMLIFEHIIDLTFKEKKKKGKKVKVRKEAIDFNIFKIYEKHILEKKSLWTITKELYPQIADKSPRDYDDNYDPDARKFLRKVERDFYKAKHVINKIKPCRAFSHKPPF